jgi:aminoglycoside phosphotransferase (APT) family kinase protein
MTESSQDVLGILTRLIRKKTGDGSARAHSLGTLPGHAGFSYSFVLERDRAAKPSGKMVVRIAPPGVKISGPADIVRQANIMASFAGTVIPAPPIYWFGDEAEFFDRPYLIDGFVEGFKLGESKLPREETKVLARKAIGMLAALHAVPWEPRTAAFGEPFALAEEMKRLDHLLDRPTLDPELTALAPKLRARLLATLPEKPRIACVHGDFQWANILFDESGPTALIDWEISLIGPALLDVGWISFFADPKSFHDGARGAPPILSTDEIAQAYQTAATFPVSQSDIDWFRAFSGYRFAVITCFNVMLHRRGKRHDPLWEDRAPSAPTMFSRALELLG